MKTAALTVLLTLAAAISFVAGSHAPIPGPVEHAGCCSHHKGVCGCSSDHALCCDNTISKTCGCD